MSVVGQPSTAQGVLGTPEQARWKHSAVEPSAVSGNSRAGQGIDFKILNSRAQAMIVLVLVLDTDVLRLAPVGNSIINKL